MLISPQRLNGIFGCWHQKMNYPFTRNDETYRTCLRCGARRQFNVAQSKMTGPYYFPSPAALYNSPLPKQIVNATQLEQTDAALQQPRTASIKRTA
jgi:hypothetical protein